MGKKILAWFGAGIFFLIVLGIAMLPLEEPAGGHPSAAASASSWPMILPEEEDPPAEVTGSPAVTPTPLPSPSFITAPNPAPVTLDYVLNTNTGKFHVPSCSSIDLMNEENKQFFTGTRDSVIAQGYEPCQHCDP